jgi:uncharacterized protein YbcI
LASRETLVPAKVLTVISLLLPGLTAGRRRESRAGMSGSSQQPSSGEQSDAARISNLVVQSLRAYTGRGPTKVWTSIDADLISVVTRDLLSAGERSLIEDGRHELVLQMRQAYQYTMRTELVNGVQEITGRTVQAFLSANHLDPDIAVESFVLEPRPHSAA